MAALGPKHSPETRGICRRRPAVCMKGEFNLSPSCSSGWSVTSTAHRANCPGSSVLWDLPMPGSVLAVCQEGCAMHSAQQQLAHGSGTWCSSCPRSSLSSLVWPCTACGDVLVVKSWPGICSSGSGRLMPALCKCVLAEEQDMDGEGTLPIIEGGPQELPRSHPGKSTVRAEPRGSEQPLG